MNYHMVFLKEWSKEIFKNKRKITVGSGAYALVNCPIRVIHKINRFIQSNNNSTTKQQQKQQRIFKRLKAYIGVKL